jgi:hypothetical protein
MKVLTISALAFLVLMGSIEAADECESARKRLISVTGTGEVTRSPDLAMIHVGVTTEHLRASRCYSENNEIMQAVRSALLGLGVGEDDIKTSRFTLNPQYEYPGGGVRKFIGYKMQHMYTVKIRDLDILGNALDASSEAGANEISNIAFTIDDPSEAQAEAREMAVKDAEAKAEAIARAASVKIARVYRISEGAVSMPQTDVEFFRAKAMSAPSAPVEAGSQEVRITVSVHYEIK